MYSIFFFSELYKVKDCLCVANNSAWAADTFTAASRREGSRAFTDDDRCNVDRLEPWSPSASHRQPFIYGAVPAA